MSVFFQWSEVIPVKGQLDPQRCRDPWVEKRWSRVYILCAAGRAGTPEDGP